MAPRNIIGTKALECPSCGAVVQQGQPRCLFCGTPLTWEEPAQQQAAAPVVTGTEKLVDYYAMLGISHANGTPPTQLEIREGALKAQQRVMANTFMDRQEINAQLEDIEIAIWILTNDIERRNYDSLLKSFRSGFFNEQHLLSLQAMQQEARQELGLLNDDVASTPTDLVQQGKGYQALGMFNEAAAAFKRAIDLLPDSAEAHYGYGLAVVSDGNPMSKTSHELRLAANSFQAAVRLDPGLTDAAAYAALCQGLLAREMDEWQKAEDQLREAVRLKPKMGIGWRALATLALRARNHSDVFACCRRALLANPRDEHAYLLLVTSCWQAGQHDFARDAADRVAKLRGGNWTAEKVLREIVH